MKSPVFARRQAMLTIGMVKHTIFSTMVFAIGSQLEVGWRSHTAVVIHSVPVQKHTISS
jgi:hypothetical protein